MCLAHVLVLLSLHHLLSARKGASDTVCILSSPSRYSATFIEALISASEGIRNMLETKFWLPDLPMKQGLYQLKVARKISVFLENR